MFFFFKQKTAYEIYQCDWSSDVCSSDLTRLIKSTVGVSADLGGSFSARTRHLDALKRTLAHVIAGHRQLEKFNAPETLAEELRLAQKALGEITGEYLPDDLLGAIFSSFCIGK